MRRRSHYQCSTQRHRTTSTEINSKDSETPTCTSNNPLIPERRPPRYHHGNIEKGSAALPKLDGTREKPTDSPTPEEDLPRNLRRIRGKRRALPESDRPGTWEGPWTRPRKRPRTRSRRISTRKERWERKTHLKQGVPLTNESIQNISNHLTFLKSQYGFIADPNKNTTGNLIKLIGEMPPDTYFNRPTNRRLHNLLSRGAPTGRLKAILGMGLNYCIREDRPTNNTTKTFQRLRRDIRRINFWSGQGEDNNDYNPKLYISQEKWFDRASPEIEEGIDAFEREYREIRNKRYRKPTPPNLSAAQILLATQQKLNDWTIVVPSDKNLGPCILDREEYITRAMKEHLGDEETYAILDERACASIMQLLRQAQEMWISRHRSSLTRGDVRFLQTTRSRARDKIAKFRMSMKVHKTPIKTRPIVCCVGTFMNYWSRWLDYYLRKLTPFVKSYVKDTRSIVEYVRGIKNLPSTAMLFTADAQSMYTNIDTNHAITVIGNWLDHIKTEPTFPKDWPFEAIKEAMSLIMKFNIFEFGNLRLHQIRGTAMGTSAACIWATIYYAIHENECILPRYSSNLFEGRLHRFIDDIFGIWIPDRIDCCETEQPWINFCRDLQTFGLLRWDISKLSTSVTFLDLNITIEHNEIKTATYQKEMNLYLYLPGSSAHPNGTIKGTIYGQMLSYYENNSRYEDYIRFTCLLYQRLMARGHQQSVIRPIFLESHASITSRRRTNPLTPQNDDTNGKHAIYLHFTYHPEDVPRSIIRGLYYKHMAAAEQLLNLAPPVVAYSRPTNLGEICSQSKLHEAPGRDAITHLAEYTTAQGQAPRSTNIRYLPVVSQRQRQDTQLTPPQGSLSDRTR